MVLGVYMAYMQLVVPLKIHVIMVYIAALILHVFLSM